METIPTSRTVSMPRGTGFTVIEMVVMLAILVLTASILFVGFPTLSGRTTVQRAARELGLNLRRAQNLAIAGRALSSGEVPPAYGIYFDRAAAPNSYIIFADTHPAGSPDGRFSPPSSDVVVETGTLPRGVSFEEEFMVNLGFGQEEKDELHIVFSIPEGLTSIRDDSESVQSAEIFLTGQGTGFERSVVVRVTGLVHIK